MDLKKWPNGSAQKCKAVWDCLSKVYTVLGSLPDGKTPEILLGTTVEQILDFGEKVAEDDMIWASMPIQIIPGEKEVLRRYDNFVKIAATSAMTVGIDEYQEVLTEYEKGISSEKLRKDLCDVLNESK